MSLRDDYPLSTWVIDLRDLMAKREFIKKQDTLLLITESLDEFYDLYSGGASPYEAYLEYIE